MYNKSRMEEYYVRKKRLYSSRNSLWRRSATKLSDSFATQDAIPSKRKADMPNASISLRFFGIFGRMHTRQPSRMSHKRVRSGDIEGQQRKESVSF